MPFEIAAELLHPSSMGAMLGVAGGGAALSKLLRTQGVTDFLFNGVRVNAPKQVMDPLMPAILRAGLGSPGDEQ